MTDPHSEMLQNLRRSQNILIAVMRKLGVENEVELLQAVDKLKGEKERAAGICDELALAQKATAIGAMCSLVARDIAAKIREPLK